MLQVDINWASVLAAAVASMVVGFLWYGPLFGKPWMKLMGLTEAKINEAKKNMSQTYALSFVGSMVMAYVLANFTNLSGSIDMIGGATVGFWAWLGFVAPVQMTEVLFGGKSWNLYFINTGYQLASLLVMGAIITSWM